MSQVVSKRPAANRWPSRLAGSPEIAVRRVPPLRGWAAAGFAAGVLTWAAAGAVGAAGGGAAGLAVGAAAGGGAPHAARTATAPVETSTRSAVRLFIDTS